MIKERIGMAGLGFMGRGLAKNIVEGGWPLSVLAHHKREAIDDLVRRGAREVASPRALAEASDVVVLCVTGSPQVEAIIEGPEGLLSVGKPLLVIDCSTSDPASTRRMVQVHAPRGLTLVDAPLGRTPKEAWEGTLDVMAGGDPEAMARARPVIETFAGRIVETGPVGTGHAMKLLNNFLSMGYAAIYSEALMLAAKAGLKLSVFDEVIRGGRMDCAFYQTFMRYIIERDPNAHRFALANGLKDVTYLSSFAQALGVANPIGAAVRNSFAGPVASGRGEDYVPMLADHVAAANGVSLRTEP